MPHFADILTTQNNTLYASFCLISSGIYQFYKYTRKNVSLYKLNYSLCVCVGTKKIGWNIPDRKLMNSCHKKFVNYIYFFAATQYFSYSNQ